MIALPICSFFLFLDRWCGGVFSILLPIIQIIPLVLFYSSNGLWKKRGGEFVIVEGCSAVFLLLGLIEQYLCTPVYPWGWIFAMWLIPLLAWLLLIGTHHGFSLKGLVFAAVMTVSLFSFAFFWTENANISLDRSAPSTVYAKVTDYEQTRTGKGGRQMRIKLSFAYDSKSTVSCWFDIQNTDDYYRLTARTQLPIKRHKGALGASWYEPDFTR